MPFANLAIFNFGTVRVKRKCMFCLPTAVSFQIPSYLGTEWVGRRLLDKNIPELSMWTFETIRDGNKVTMVSIYISSLNILLSSVYSVSVYK